MDKFRACTCGVCELCTSAVSESVEASLGKRKRVEDSVVVASAAHSGDGGTGDADGDSRHLGEPVPIVFLEKEVAGSDNALAVVNEVNDDDDNDHAGAVDDDEADDDDDIVIDDDDDVIVNVNAVGAGGVEGEEGVHGNKGLAQPRALTTRIADNIALALAKLPAKERARQQSFSNSTILKPRATRLASRILRAVNDALYHTMAGEATDDAPPNNTTDNNSNGTSTGTGTGNGCSNNIENGNDRRHDNSSMANSVSASARGSASSRSGKRESELVVRLQNIHRSLLEPKSSKKARKSHRNLHERELEQQQQGFASIADAAVRTNTKEQRRVLMQVLAYNCTRAQMDLLMSEARQRARDDEIFMVNLRTVAASDLAAWQRPLVSTDSKVTHLSASFHKTLKTEYSALMSTGRASTRAPYKDRVSADRIEAAVKVIISLSDGERTNPNAKNNHTVHWKRSLNDQEFWAAYRKRIDPVTGLLDGVKPVGRPTFWELMNLHTRKTKAAKRYG